jgi:hypothetical protein
VTAIINDVAEKCDQGEIYVQYEISYTLFAVGMIRKIGLWFLIAGMIKKFGYHFLQLME